MMSFAPIPKPHNKQQSGKDSIPAPKTMSVQETNWDILSASELGTGEPPEWVWDGYLAKGYTTLMIGLWKAGKTTLLAHLLVGTADGGEIATPIKPGRILVVTEESGGQWAYRRDEVGIADNVCFLIRPFKGRPSLNQWSALIVSLSRIVTERDIDAVVFDTFSAVSPCTNENDAAEMNAALTPLHTLTEQDTAVLIIHHPKKGDAREGQAARGSGALTGFVDVIIEFRRYEAEQRDDRRRVLTTYSRFDETPPEQVIELTDTGYNAVGTKANAKKSDRIAVIKEILPTNSSDGVTVEQVCEAWIDKAIPKPGVRTISSDLVAGFNESVFIRTGNGVKNNPYRYSNSIPARSQS